MFRETKVHRASEPWERASASETWSIAETPFDCRAVLAGFGGGVMALDTAAAPLKGDAPEPLILDLDSPTPLGRCLEHSFFQIVPGAQLTTVRILRNAFLGFQSLRSTVHGRVNRRVYAFHARLEL